MIALLTAPGAFGGLESVVAALTSALAGAGERVMLVAVLDAGAPVPAWMVPLAAAGVVVAPLHVASRSYTRERRQVSALLDRHGVDIVHSHGYRADLVHGAAARRDGRGTVSTVHGFTQNGLKGRFYEALQVRALRRFDAVVAVSLPLVGALAARGVPAARIRLVQNRPVPPALPPLDRMAARASLGLPVDERWIGWIGRLSPEKAPELAIEALSLLKTPNVRLCVIGDGALRAACAGRAATLGIADRVRFAGALPDASRSIGAFDALVLSSRTEGTPMVVIEAGMAGVPVIATRVGGVPDLLGDDGCLVPPNDPTALAAALDAAFADPSATGAGARRLRKRLKRESQSSTWVDLHRAIYREVARLR